MIITSNNFPDWFSENALPFLRKTIANKFKAKKKIVPMVFDERDSTNPMEQVSGFSGLGYAAQIDETGEIPTDAPVQEFDVTAKHRTFGLAVEYSRDMFEDDKWRIINRAAIELANSVAETCEVDGASIFNLGFSTNGYDQVPLFSLNHPLVKGGGVQANTLSAPADLNVTSLQAALTDWATMRRSNRHHIELPTPRLLVAANNHWNAHEILKGQWRSDTANNTVNAFKYGETGPVEQIITWAKLTNPKFWALLAPPEQTGLFWYWRVKPYQFPFKDDRTQRAGIAIRYRKVQGWEDYLGTYASPGV